MTDLDILGPVFAGEFFVDELQICQQLPAIEKQAREISGRSKSFDYTLKQCFEGTLTELGILNALAARADDATLNPMEFDHKNPESYAWDVGATVGEEFERFEVKKLRNGLDNKYFEFNFRTVRPGLDLTTFLTHGFYKTRCLVLATCDLKPRGVEDEIEYIVRPKYIIDSTAFPKYCKETQRVGAPLTHYVDLDEIVKNKHAIKF